MQAGTYAGGIQVSKAVTLLGANSAASPTGGGWGSAAQSIIEPSASEVGADPYALGSTILIQVLSSNVAIEGLTLDGSNSSLSLPASAENVALTETGATPIYAQAAEGIASFNPAGISNISAYGDIPAYANPANVTIQNNIIENLSYQGVDIGWGSNGAQAAGASNVISQNLFQNVGYTNDEGDAVRLYNNFYANVANNQILNTRMGVELGNYSSTNIEATGSVVDNQIQVRRRGILYNLMYAPGFTYPVIGNTITATPDDLTLGGSVWAGVYMMTQQGNVMPTFQGNTINASGSNYATTAGYVATYVDSTATALISGGSVSNVTYGVWEDSQDPNYFSSIDSNVALTVSGVSISASTYGVYVHDTSSTYSVAAAIENNTSITTTGGSGTGIFVSGAKASATISGNHIYDNGTGIEFTAGGGGAVGQQFRLWLGFPRDGQRHGSVDRFHRRNGDHRRRQRLCRHDGLHPEPQQPELQSFRLHDDDL